MSLINDALRRAKQQTAQPMPTRNLPLRPAEPASQPERNSPVLLTAIFAGILIAAGFATPLLMKPGRNTVEVASVTPTVSAKAEAVSETKALPIEVSAASPSNNVATPDPVSTSTSSEPAAEAPKAEAKLKLNGILFQASNPSAIVNGKTVFTNGRVGEFRVASITPASVVLVNGSATNVLSLDE